MSVRIQNDAATNDTAAALSRAGQSPSVLPGSGNARTAFGADGADRVDVSSVTESISAGVSAQNVQRSDRVSQLSALYAKGQYNVDSAQVSRAIVDSAVTASPAGKA